MHHLLRLVLEQKDLSRAGELFSLDDCEIEGCLSEALEQIKLISSSPDYQMNDNDQAVVEICITRITSAIRETESIEKHGKALIDLWESCLEHNLKPFCKDEDTPHAKIASDIMSCILQNYNRPPIIALAVPVAVKFLQRSNKELCRNLSNYLSLAAISKAELLAEHTEIIVKSILQDFINKNNPTQEFLLATFSTSLQLLNLLTMVHANHVIQKKAKDSLKPPPTQQPFFSWPICKIPPSGMMWSSAISEEVTATFPFIHKDTVPLTEPQVLQM
ncbi:ventricular zone-expressed PH domain-containing protein homolog 1 isoform X8 [Crotalus tigris]|nr:ventricular zone-expressed PH domain-containing protein homolog 1 isoform X8 [Crotalus tigris]